MRYTVVYEGDPAGVKILSGETAPGKAVTVHAGDLMEEVQKLRTLLRLYGLSSDDVDKQLKDYTNQ